ncbi:MAG: initiation factor 2B [Roseiflexaceae bacterium]
MDNALAHAVARIAADKRSGAALLAERAADVLLRRATTGEAASPDAFRAELLATGWALIQAQPVMAPMVNLVNTVLWKLEEQETPAALRQAVADATAHFKRQIKHHALRVAENALALIEDGMTVVTLSQSSTVQHALFLAQRAGRRFSVVCAESRPSCEGREMAANLAARGLSVKLLIDTAAVASVARAHLVIVGADLLGAAGLVNKIGTHALALAGQASAVPLYTLCSSEKLLPTGYPPPEQRLWPSNEIWADAPDGVEVDNQYYDFTPLHHISGIVTEHGILPTETVEGWLAATKLHPSLAARVQDLLSYP